MGEQFATRACGEKTTERHRDTPGEQLTKGDEHNLRAGDRTDRDHEHEGRDETVVEAEDEVTQPIALMRVLLTTAGHVPLSSRDTMPRLSIGRAFATRCIPDCSCNSLPETKANEAKHGVDEQGD